MKSIYVVKEYNNDVYATHKFDLAIHEMLSIILQKIQYTGDVYSICVEKRINDPHKRFPYVLDNYRPHVGVNGFMILNNDGFNAYYNTSKQCDALLYEIQQSLNTHQNQSFNNNHIQTHHTHRYSMDTSSSGLSRTLSMESSINSSIDSCFAKKCQNVCQNVQQTNQQKSNGKIIVHGKSKDNNNEEPTLDKLIEETNKLLTEADTNLNKIHFSEDVQKEYNAKNKKNIDDDSENDSNGSNDSDDSDIEIDFDDTDIDANQNTILEQMRNLINYKKSTEKKLNELKKVQDINREQFNEFNSEINFLKKQQYKEKEIEEDYRRRFESDKRTFAIVQNDVDSGKIEEKDISDLFADKYDLFTLMTENNIDLDTEDAYLIYRDHLISKKKNEPKQPYIPHNASYITSDGSGQQKVRPIQDILADIDDESEYLPEVKTFHSMFE